jgi:fatty-acyl-CoA synthase/long-chain acyl-CoA synthetase
MDDEGYVWVVDRKKDMIISGGENIYCAEVENVLAGHPKIADVALIGVPDPRWGEAPLAVLVPTDPADPPTTEEIVRYGRERMAGYKCPRRISVVATLPRNPSGKILKTELRKMYTSGDTTRG